MRTFTLAILAAALITYATVQETYSTASDYASVVWLATIGVDLPDIAKQTRIQRIRYMVWGDLCYTYRKVSCAGIPPPKIETFKPQPWRPGLAGYYNGTDTIYIRNDLVGAEREEVLAHEMSHYWDVSRGLTRVPGPALDVCFSEKRAWAVSDAFWINQGLDPSNKRIVGSKWVMWYTHCTPLKEQLYPDIYGAN